jgi:hypothetical protein
MEPSRNAFTCGPLAMIVEDFPATGLTTTRISGCATKNALLQAFKIRYRIPTRFNLIDISEVRFDALLQVGGDDSFGVPAYFKLFDPSFLEIRLEGKTAVLVADPVQGGVAIAFLSMLDTLVNTPVTTRVYYSEKRALEWLETEGMQPANMV